MIDPKPVVQAPQVPALFKPPAQPELETCGQCGARVVTPCDWLAGNPCYQLENHQ